MDHIYNFLRYGILMIIIGCGGGTPVPPAPRPRAILIGGQSNAQQPNVSLASGLPLALQSPQPDVLFSAVEYGSATAPTPSIRALAALAPTPSHVHGIEITLGHQLSVLGHRVVLCNFSIGGSGLIRDWLGNNRLDEAISSWQSQLAAAGAAYDGGGPLEPIALPWVQGEEDAAESIPSATYKSGMDTMMSRVRAVWPNLTIVLHKLNPTSLFGGGPAVEAVRTGEDDFVAVDPHALMDVLDDATTDGQPTLADGLHYWSVPMQIIGTNQANLIHTLF